MKKTELLKKLKKCNWVYIAIPTNNGNDFTYVRVDGKDLAEQLKDSTNSNDRPLNDFWVTDNQGNGEFLWFEINPIYLSEKDKI